MVVVTPLTAAVRREEEAEMPKAVAIITAAAAVRVWASRWGRVPSPARDRGREGGREGGKDQQKYKPTEE